jgi:hypothetical protein
MLRATLKLAHDPMARQVPCRHDLGVGFRTLTGSGLTRRRFGEQSPPGSAHDAIRRAPRNQRRCRHEGAFPDREGARDSRSR